MTERKELGTHTILEFYGCQKDILKDSKRIEAIFKEASKISNATIVKSTFHYFNPHGVSGVIIISESHFSIHTWPEYGYAAVDFFSCSEKVNIELPINYLEKALKPSYISRIELKRGILL